MDKLSVFFILITLVVCDSKLVTHKNKKSSQKYANEIMKETESDFTAATDVQTYAQTSDDDDLDLTRVITYAWPFNQLILNHNNTTEEDGSKERGDESLPTTESAEFTSVIKPKPHHAPKSDKPRPTGGDKSHLTHYKGQSNKRRWQKTPKQHMKKHDSQQATNKKNKGIDSNGKKHTRSDAHHHKKRTNERAFNKRVKPNRDLSLQQQKRDKQMKRQIRQRLQRLKRSHDKERKSDRVRSLLMIEPNSEKRAWRYECKWRGAFRCNGGKRSHDKRQRRIARYDD